MQFKLQSILLASLAAYAPTVFGFSEQLNDVFRQLSKADTGGMVQLSEQGGLLQSLDKAGNVIAQVAITWQQEAEIRYEMSLQYAKGLEPGGAVKKRFESRNALLKPRACYNLAYHCYTAPECFQYGCSLCLGIVGRVLPRSGLCVGYN
ncbi:hypothetical protein ISF_05658 [Cordyceps fumosorosea ARSEF 2679]|uniref:Uncharacterized protein n=1 Tax=Cordyceps fumosorosea (strain ARSEF 2679) TaxID=1081104 RepID=A0A167UHF0_CORFA|nr:hypothetical protein ISF_05658 [Cordyceps fumosorosea ARSEF 2679]OAA61579.1 hypothetical protein ISF_05658 [Cordyceps fumosorosea ARSEF 2679]